MTVSTLAALALALFVFLKASDRLRLVNWRTTRPSCVVAQLAQVGLALWVLYDGFTVGVAWWQWALLLADIAWLAISWWDWHDGPPNQVLSKFQRNRVRLR